MRTGKWKMMLAINCYHLIDSRGTPTPNLSRYHHVRPASGKCHSIQKRLETGTTYTPKWRSRKSWLVQETTAYILTLSPMFLFAHVRLKKNCIAQTSFVTFGLFEYASAHQIQWHNSQPNDGGHLVVEVEVSYAALGQGKTNSCEYTCTTASEIKNTKHLRPHVFNWKINISIYDNWYMDASRTLSGIPQVRGLASALKKNITQS